MPLPGNNQAVWVCISVCTHVRLVHFHPGARTVGCASWSHCLVGIMNQCCIACMSAFQELAAEDHDLLQGNSLFLVGMMGSGQSTVGLLLEKALKYPLLVANA